MKYELLITPAGHLRFEPNEEGWASSEAFVKLMHEQLASNSYSCLLSLVRESFPNGLPDSLQYFRKLVKEFLTRLCHAPEPTEKLLEPLFVSIRPDSSFFAFEQMQLPPMRGAEYLTAEALMFIWTQLEEAIQIEYDHFKGNFSDCIRNLNPAWKQIGKVSFHLAENKQDTTGQRPFAFMATFIHRLSENDKPKHLPLGAALKAYASDKNTLVTLLKPVKAASVGSKLIEGLINSREIYTPLTWSSREACEFLKDIPVIEAAGIIVRIANLWKNNTPSKVKVGVKIDVKKGQSLGLDTMFEFDVEASLNGVALTKEELQQLLNSKGGIVRIKGEWVEADPEKIKALLAQWGDAQQTTQQGLTFMQGMRLLAGARDLDKPDGLPDIDHEYNAIEAVGQLKKLLTDLDSPDSIKMPKLPESLLKTLRPYQLDGVKWLWRMTELGLGGCLADDMGLGKTLQILSLLTLLKQRGDTRKSPAILVVPASLVKNWEREAKKFTPDLRLGLLHPMAMSAQDLAELERDPEIFLQAFDAIVTTYGMLIRLEKLRDIIWTAVIVDEAQAIKNPQSQQSKAVRCLLSSRKLALTGTPVENRLTDLWSIFDFINPGLLGKVKSFKTFIDNLKDGDGNVNFAPFRKLIKPYIMRRLKTDKRIISDLPDKTEMKVYCQLTKPQALLYQQTVTRMAKEIDTLDDTKRRGLIFKYLMAFKQICNHPAHYDGSGAFKPENAGKFLRLSEIVEEISSRQEKIY